MRGKGRSNDNANIERLWRTLKYEWTLLNGYRGVADYKKLLPKFVAWPNHTRPHQALNYQTPAEVLVSRPGGYEENPDDFPTISTRPNSICNQERLS